MTRRLGWAAALVLLTSPLGSAAGQGLPPYFAVNPLITSRSGLFFQPYLDPKPSWQVRFLLDYGSSIEYIERLTERLLLDGELLRMETTVLRDVGPAFLGASFSFNGAYNGFLDGFLDWYHDITGLRVPPRELRPQNEFDYLIVFPNGTEIEREPAGGFFGDLRVLGGYRFSRHLQTTVAVTLPTSSGPTGYGRGVASASAVTTVRSAGQGRLGIEASAGAGYTPKHGDLSEYQRTFFHSLSTGARFRFWGRQAMFVNLFYQSASYEGTTFRAMDHRELTLDYGFLLKSRGGPEWFLGMTEDIEPRGPAIDLAFRIGARW